jgi:G2/mitotic-specific cyclin-B, other
MLKTEKKWNADPNYMSHQVKIDETIRSTLVDWLIQIHYNFKLLPETLFLTVNLIDRYMSKHQIAKREVQLVGIASLLIVAKYEEIYPPLLKDFVFITDKTYTSEEILDMEKKILFALDFDLNLCSSYRFLERFSKLAKLDQVSFFLSQYMLELGLLDSKMSQFS